VLVLVRGDGDELVTFYPVKAGGRGWVNGAEIITIGKREAFD
jgi:hypothetical protein